MSWHLDGTFVKVYRSLLEWEWFTDSAVMHVLMYLLLSARWKDGRWKGVEIPPGSFPTSIDTIAVATRLTPKQVRRALEILREGKVIETEKAGKGQRISLVNWAKYQEQPIEEGRERAGRGQEKGRERAGKGQEKGNTIRREEGYKGRREEGKNEHQLSTIADVQDLFPDPGPTFEDFWSAYRKGSRKLSAEQWDKLSKKDREAAFSAIRAYIGSRPDPKYRKDGERFLRHRTWEDPIIDNSTPNGTPQKPSALSEADKLNAALAILQRNDARQS